VDVPGGVEGKWYVHVFTAVRVGRFGPSIGATEPGSYPDWPEYFKDYVWESPDRGNNFRASSAVEVTYREADLRISRVTAVPSPSSSGGFVTVTFTVTNAGTRATRTDSWLDRVYLSIDGSLDLYDALLGSFTHKGVLAPGAEYTVTGEVRLPDNFSGAFRVLAFADSPFGTSQGGGIPRPYPEAQGPARLMGSGSGMVLEYRDEFNNSASTPLVVTPTNPPDLQVTEVLAPARVFTGRQFQVTFTVANQGAGVVPDRQEKWADYLYLSRDQYLDARGDHYLGRVEHVGVLEVNGTYSVTLTLNLPRGLVGAYYVMVLTDSPENGAPRGVVYEGTAEGNNSRATAVPMLIELPPPSDLQVEAVTVPTQALAGQQVTFSWRVTNRGVEPASGRWADAAFLSRDAIWDLGDRLIINQDFAPRTLAPGESYTFSSTVRMPVALPNNYQVIVRTDIFDDIHEGSNNVNNATASADRIAVTVPTLQLGVPLDARISDGDDLLFRVQVPAGETLRVSIDSANDALSNELYVRYEAMPSSREFDAAFGGGLQGDQVALVGRTEGGYYYIRVRNFRDATLGTDTPPRFRDVSLVVTARVLPFGITQVTPDTGGDSRYVTVTVRGAKFDPSATLKLVRPQIAEFAPISYQVIDATTIVATFDLRNAARGLYDVQVTNPNGAQAIVPYRFLVEAAKPLDVTVGLGGPGDIPISRTGVSPALYQAGYLSITNLDTPYAHVSFGVPRLANNSILAGQPIGGGRLSVGERLRFSTNLTGAPGIDGVPWGTLNPVLNLDGTLTAEGFVFDLHNQGFGAVSFLAEVYPELNDILRENPRFLEQLQSFEIEDLEFNFFLFATVTPMSPAEYVAYQTAQAESVRQAILADSEAPQGLRVAAADASAFTSFYLASLTASGQLRAEDLPPAIRSAPQFTGSMALAAAGLLGMAGSEAIRTGGDFESFFAQLRRWSGDEPDAFGSGTLPTAAQHDLNQTRETRFEAFIIHVGPSGLGESQDQAGPVQDSSLGDLFGLTGERSRLVRISGPTGYGATNLVPSGASLPYSVRFAADETRTEAVNEIRVIQQLDADLDARTFRLGDIRLGDLVLAMPDRASFTAEYDFTSTLGYVVQVTAGVDVESRLATWLIRAIDPDTGLTLRGRNAQTGQSQGLLRPGQAGTVGYTVSASDAAVTGAAIQARARVIYEAEGPLDSNLHESILDRAAPVTTVTVRQVGTTYALDWLAVDDALGSGVKEYNVYLSLDGGPFVLHVARTEEMSLVYESTLGLDAVFLVRAQDQAGNLEAAPDGVLIPTLYPSVNLGALPRAPATVVPELAVAEPSTQPATNPLFLELLRRIPGLQSAARPAEFLTVFEPFTTSAFAFEIPQSGAGIGPLGIAFTPDGKSVLISGGAGRNTLWKFGLSGGNADRPLVTLDVPIYDMAFDGNGLLWATTGGGPLVQLDPETGAILERHGEGVTLGMVIDGTRNRIFVATGRGVDVFDVATRTFSPFSATRVDGLALSPSGELWGTVWPEGGQVVRFNARGRAEVMLTLGQEAEGLAFGVPGTPTENLLFVTHATGGALTVVDLVSMRHAEVATGGGRGDFIHVNADGRVFVTQSGQVTVLFPVVAPRVIATTPVGASRIDPIVNIATIRFDLDMLATSAADPASVLNPGNYRLRNLATGQDIRIGTVTYEVESRTARLVFESLGADAYQLEVRDTVRSDLGVAMAQSFTAEFTVLQDLTPILAPQFSDTRLNRIDGTVSFEVRVTNSLSFALASPVRVIFTGLTEGHAPLVEVLTADGVTQNGNPYLDLAVGEGALLLPGQSVVRTVTIRNPDFVRLQLQTRVAAGVPPNLRPAFSSSPGLSGSVGTHYTYAAQAADPDGPSVTYVLVAGPGGALVDASTGLVSWTPSSAQGRAVPFELRAYDTRGGYTAQTWTVAVANANTPPVLFPIANQTVREGEAFNLALSAVDAEGDVLVFGVNHLPPGAFFDGQTQSIRWTPDGLSAGRYSGIEVQVTDGTSVVSRTFEILVLEVNQAPVLQAIPARFIREGDALGLFLEATDVDGDVLVFSSDNLPLGATLHPQTGQFAWTPRYDQHGSYQLRFSVTDGLQAVTRVMTLEVANVNGPVTFQSGDRFVTFEGQTLTLRLGAEDPDHPENATVLLPDGTLDPAGNGGVLLWTSSALPTGAVFDAATQTLRWTPAYNQSGTHRVTFTVRDDGDGTGTATQATTTIEIEVRDANGAPVFIDVPNQSVAAGGVFELVLRASDPDGTRPTFSTRDLPAFLSLVDHGDGTATLRGATSLLNRGNYTVTVIAADDGNGNAARRLTAEESFVLSVVAVNSPPRFQPVGDLVALIGETLSFQVRVTDGDQDALTFSATGLPAGATFQPTAVYGVAEFRWTPLAADAGTATITLNVADSGSGVPAARGTDAQSIRITVRTANAAPTLEAPVLPSWTEGEAASIRFTASDADGDSLLYRADQLPRGASLDPRTGVLTWTPDFTQAGNYQVRVLATDGNRTASRDVVFTVANRNQAPRFVPVSNLIAFEGSPLTFTVVAGDLDSDVLVYAIEAGLPDGAEFDPATQVFTWTPGFDQAGRHLIQFVTTDTAGGTDRTEVELQVLNTNRLPVLPVLGARQAIVSEPFRLVLGATDPDSDSVLVFSGQELPAGATLNGATGELRWTPTGVQVGGHDLRITVSDGEESVTRTLRLVVSTEPVVPNVLVQVTPGFPVPAGQTVLLQA
ncbi:MAG: putative Ig domain-containing protein, partial [Verrucomicrobiales bacterium]|nr:putative Ig domain-containing protein [Verrucomicrobiales bacterium]